MSNIKDIIRLLYPVRVIAFGLAVAQVIATVLVYLSNRAVAEKIAAIQAAGYGPLSGVNIDPLLTSLEAAFAGGVFFTLSTGAGVVLLTFGAVLLVSAWPPVYRVYKIALLNPGRRVLAMMVLLPVAAAGTVLVIGWPFLLIRANLNGFCPGLSAFLVLVPPAVAWAALKWSPRNTTRKRLPWRNPFHFALIGILLALWASHVNADNADVFLDFKDNLLLTSRPGVGVVDFYYRYTLYPAEVFKRQSDKQLKTCRLERCADTAMAGRLEKALRRHDYFVIPAPAAGADLKLSCRGDRLSLEKGGKSVLDVDRNRFLNETGEILRVFSEKTDNNAYFRRFTIISLVGVAPLVLYLATYGFFCLLPGVLTGVRVASFLAPLLCFVFWTGVMMMLGTPPLSEMNEAGIAAAMRDGTRKERLAALRYVNENRLDITDFPDYRGLLETTDLAQRYWLLNNLGHSREATAGETITRFFKADSAYIVCKAVSAAARWARKQGQASRRLYREPILRKMEVSDNWYVQFYAYKAARRLGWMPEKSR